MKKILIILGLLAVACQALQAQSIYGRWLAVHVKPYNYDQLVAGLTDSNIVILKRNLDAKRDVGHKCEYFIITKKNEIVGGSMSKITLKSSSKKMTKKNAKHAGVYLPETQQLKFQRSFSDTTNLAVIKIIKYDKHYMWLAFPQPVTYDVEVPLEEEVYIGEQEQLGDSMAPATLDDGYPTSEVTSEYDEAVAAAQQAINEWEAALFKHGNDSAMLIRSDSIAYKINAQEEAIELTGITLVSCELVAADYAFTLDGSGDTVQVAGAIKYYIAGYRSQTNQQDGYIQPLRIDEKLYQINFALLADWEGYFGFAIGLPKHKTATMLNNKIYIK
jgi:hypothetical protein